MDSTFTPYSSPETNSTGLKASQTASCVNFEDKFSVLKSCTVSTMSLLPDEVKQRKASVPN
jgi:hypothetical protein